MSKIRKNQTIKFNLEIFSNVKSHNKNLYNKKMKKGTDFISYCKQSMKITNLIVRHFLKQKYGLQDLISLFCPQDNKNCQKIIKKKNKKSLNLNKI